LPEKVASTRDNASSCVGLSSKPQIGNLSPDGFGLSTDGSFRVLFDTASEEIVRLNECGGAKPSDCTKMAAATKPATRIFLRRRMISIVANLFPFRLVAVGRE
jgi:hypothetical protein